MLHVYIGDGKGKTTAALGLAVRALGWGKRVYIAQFLKNKNIESGEVRMLEKNRAVTIERFDQQIHPIFLAKRDYDKVKLKGSTRDALVKIIGLMKQGRYDLFILDEILNSLSLGVINENDLELLLTSSAGLEVVFTGRKASRSLVRKADYVSRVINIKHPFAKGCRARQAIEY